jgi:hypothetical protein
MAPILRSFDLGIVAGLKKVNFPEAGLPSRTGIVVVGLLHSTEESINLCLIYANRHRSKVVP